MSAMNPSIPSYRCLLAVLAAALGLLAQPAAAQLELLDFGAPTKPVTAQAVVLSDQVHVGSPTAVAVVIDIADTYHINPDAARSGPEWFPGQYPTTLRLVDPPAGVRAGPVQFPEPKPYAVEYADQEILVYEGKVTLYVPLLLDPDIEPATLDLQFELEVQACDPQVCLIPELMELNTSFDVVPVGTELAEASPETQATFADFDPAGWAAIGETLDSDTAHAATEKNISAAAQSAVDGGMDSGWDALLQQLVIALAAGFILNFTPCVLPVVPLKVMSLAQHGSAAGGRKRTILLALVMAGGILGFWMAIGGALVGFKQFDAVSDLFQYPEFNLAVGVVIGVLAVSMLGVFTVNLPRAVYQINPTSDTVAGSFGFGIMTAVLATPCAGPLMGFAVAWATLQGMATVLMVFAALGIGMALPYLLLTLFPELVNKLPRAGAGSELLKQTMGILMLAAAAFFVGVGIVALTSDGTKANSQLHWWAVGALVVVAGVWLMVRGLTKVCQTAGGRRFVAASGLALIVSGGWLGFANAWPDAARASAADGELPEEGIPWIYYTPDRLAEQLAEGRVVVLDFTAEWCLNCKALEKAVLETDQITAMLREDGVAPVKVDITSRRNVDGNNLLKEMGRVTIPLLVVLDGEGNEVFKADFYTVDQVADAIDRARGGGAVAQR